MPDYNTSDPRVRPAGHRSPTERPLVEVDERVASERIASAATPAELRRIAGYLPEARRWLLVAAHARVFDRALIDQLLEIPPCRPLLADNPHLMGWRLQRLVLWALRTRITMDREATDSPYGVLLALARSGRLARFGFALHELVRRYVRATNLATSWCDGHQLVPRVILACPELPVDVLLAFERKLVGCGAAGDPRRAAIARHSSATVEVWRTMLEGQPSARVVYAISQIEAAMGNAEIRRLLGADR